MGYMLSGIDVDGDRFIKWSPSGDLDEAVSQAEESSGGKVDAALKSSSSYIKPGVNIFYLSTGEMVRKWEFFDDSGDGS